MWQLLFLELGRADGHPAAVSFSDAFAVADGQIIRGLGNIRDAFAVGLAFNNVFICMHCTVGLVFNNYMLRLLSEVAAISSVS